MIPVQCILRQAPFVGRDYFPTFLNKKNLLGTAVEIGTHRGEYASHFRREWKGHDFYTVDHWQRWYDEEDPAAQGDRRLDEEIARKALQVFRKQRVLILRKTSIEASKSFPSESVDFVYIDACHQYEAVKNDIDLWWPKVKRGGILAGHDFLCPTESHDGWGRYIQPVVLQFAVENSLVIHLVLEENNLPWSFFFIKE